MRWEKEAAEAAATVYSGKEPSLGRWLGSLAEEEGKKPWSGWGRKSVSRPRSKVPPHIMTAQRGGMADGRLEEEEEASSIASV